MMHVGECEIAPFFSLCENACVVTVRGAEVTAPVWALLGGCRSKGAQEKTQFCQEGGISFPSCISMRWLSAWTGGFGLLLPQFLLHTHTHTQNMSSVVGFIQ